MPPRKKATTQEIVVPSWLTARQPGETIESAGGAPSPPNMNWHVFSRPTPEDDPRYQTIFDSCQNLESIYILFVKVAFNTVEMTPTQRATVIDELLTRLKFLQEQVLELTDPEAKDIYRFADSLRKKILTGHPAETLELFNKTQTEFEEIRAKARTLLAFVRAKKPPAKKTPSKETQTNTQSSPVSAEDANMPDPDNQGKAWHAHALRFAVVHVGNGGSAIKQNGKVNYSELAKKVRQSLKALSRYRDTTSNFLPSEETIRKELSKHDGEIRKSIPLMQKAR